MAKARDALAATEANQTWKKKPDSKASMRKFLRLVAEAEERERQKQMTHTERQDYIPALSQTMADNAATGNATKNQIEASRALREAGIPGIKYFDGNSRTAGKGSRNYVVFPGEEKNLKMLERNGTSMSELLKEQNAPK